jgi:hypothetical protein
MPTLFIKFEMFEPYALCSMPNAFTQLTTDDGPLTTDNLKLDNLHQFFYCIHRFIKGSLLF